MKVAMLTYSTKPRGGVVHALKLAERLAARGVDVTLYSLNRRDDPLGLRGYFREVSVPYRIFPYEWHEDVVRRLESMILAYARNLPKDCDIYHAQDCVGGTALGRLKAQGLISAPVFRTVHHIDDFAEPRLFEFEKKALALADYRFVVSNYWKKALAELYGYDSTLAYNGIDMTDFQNLPPRRTTKPTVLFIGGLEPRKGLEYLLEAMELVAQKVPDVALVAVAKAGFRGTDEVSWFRTLAGRLGIEDRVEFLESVSQEGILRLLSDCDLLALPSKTEGWGLALMEAMACGKPVVATRVGGVPELVRDGMDGILVDACDVRGLAEAITQLLKDPIARERMGKSGRERVARFSWDETARVVLDEYRRALQGP